MNRLQQAAWIIDLIRAGQMAASKPIQMELLSWANKVIRDTLKDISKNGIVSSQLAGTKQRELCEELLSANTSPEIRDWCEDIVLFDSLFKSIELN